MEKEDFTALLTDLYRAYNPDYIEYIPQLVEKYSGMEHSAVETVILKYNRKNTTYYDQQKSTDEYRNMLIREYSLGKRPLKDFSIKDEISVKKEEIENKIEEESKKFQDNVNQTIENLKNEFSGKEKDLISSYEDKIKELNEKISSVQPTKQGLYDGIDIKIISNYTDSEIKLPNRDAMVGIGVGARIITTNKDGSGIIGLKIVDIIYDLVSDFNGKQIIEIIIDKE